MGRQSPCAAPRNPSNQEEVPQRHNNVQCRVLESSLSTSHGLATCYKITWGQRHGSEVQSTGCSSVPGTHTLIHSHLKRQLQGTQQSRLASPGSDTWACRVLHEHKIKTVGPSLKNKARLGLLCICFSSSVTRCVKERLSRMWKNSSSSQNSSPAGHARESLVLTKAAG